jgi:hypothetical protein
VPCCVAGEGFSGIDAIKDEGIVKNAVNMCGKDGVPALFAPYDGKGADGTGVA